MTIGQEGARGWPTSEGLGEAAIDDALREVEAEDRAYLDGMVDLTNSPKLTPEEIRLYRENLSAEMTRLGLPIDGAELMTAQDLEAAIEEAESRGPYGSPATNREGGTVLITLKPVLPKPINN